MPVPIATLAAISLPQPQPATTPALPSRMAVLSDRDEKPSHAPAAIGAVSAKTPPQPAALDPQAAVRTPAFQPAQPGKDSTAAQTTDNAAPAVAVTGLAAASQPADGTQQAATPLPQPPATPAPPPPAAQLANAVANLHVGADGTSHVTIRLDPAELGHLQIRISRATDGTASVSVAVERPDTLATLQSDLGHLHQALDRAGLPEARNVTMHLAAGPDQGGTGTSMGTGSGATPQGGFQQNARQHQQHAATHSPAAAATPDTLPIPTPARATAIAAGGVNITA